MHASVFSPLFHSIMEDKISACHSPCFPHMETEFWVIIRQSVLHCVWCPAVSVQCHLCQCILWNSESCWWFFQSKTFPAKRKWESWRPFFFRGPPAPKPSSRNWDRLWQTIPAFPFIRKSRAKHCVSSVSELKKTLQLGQKLVFVCKHATSRHHTSYGERLLMTQYCGVVDCCGKGCCCSRICMELSAPEPLRVVTAGAYSHCWGMRCACCWCGLRVGLESSRLATVLEKSLWIKDRLWFQSAASVFKSEVLSADQTPLASILCPWMKSWITSIPHSKLQKPVCKVWFLSISDPVALLFLI